MQATAAAIIINGKKYLFCGFRKGFPASANTCCRFVRIFGACSKRFCARRAIGQRHQPDGFSRGKKLVACFLKLVARILKSEPLIFSLLPCRIYALITGLQFLTKKAAVLCPRFSQFENAGHKVLQKTAAQAAMLYFTCAPACRLARRRALLRGCPRCPC